MIAVIDFTRSVHIAGIHYDHCGGQFISSFGIIGVAMDFRYPTDDAGGIFG